MTAVKTISRHGYKYTVKQFGNRSFRIEYKHESEARIWHVDHVFDTLEDAESYIAQCANMDALVAIGQCGSESTREILN